MAVVPPGGPLAAPGIPPDGAATALWHRIESFDLDDGAERTFIDRLADENGWTRWYAERVVTEYRRFLLLTQVSGHVCTPSDQVDQAWHLHLTCTRSYWDQLCPQVLGQPLHHNPSKGGITEGRKYTKLYEQTLDSYRTWFHQEPPADIWPPVHVRFASGASGRPFDPKAHVMIPRSLVRLGGFVLWALGAVACLAAVGYDLAELHGGTSFTVCAAALGGACLLGLIVRRWFKAPSGEPNQSDLELTTYQLAFLRDRTDGVAQAAVAGLVNDNVLEVSGKDLVRAPEAAEPTEPVAAAVLSTIGTGGYRVGDVAKKLGEPADGLRRSLQARDLVVTDHTERIGRPAAVALPLAVLAVIAAKAIRGSEEGRPVGLLVMLLIGGFAAAVFWIGKPLHRTRRGNAVLGWAKGGGLGEPVDSSLAPALAVALLGTSALSGGPLADLHKAFQSSGGDGGGCGGGGCGGGCGGD